MKLQDPRKTKTIELPSFKGSEVVVYDSVLLGDMPTDTNLQFSSIEQVTKMLPVLIKSWNFTDDEEKPLAINEENIKKLPAGDATYILEQVKEFAEESKKD